MSRIAGLALLAALAAACVSGSDGATVARSQKSRITAPNVPAVDLDELVTGNADFAFDLYRALRGESANLFFSPHSISLALAMTYAGARGSTEAEMGRTLRYTLPQGRLHPAFNKLDLALSSRGQGAAGKDGKAFRLKIANATWGQLGYSFLGAFLDVLAESYGAGLRVLDFIAAPETARQAINRWTSEQTEGRVPELLAKGVITGDTRLVLTNAVYFNAAWRTPFVKQQTTDAPFTTLDGATVTVPTMHALERLPYAESGGVQAVSLPYDGDELSLLILLPPEGKLDELETQLSAARVASIVAGLSARMVDLAMPRWKLESSFSLAGTLARMGMPSAFSTADFSGIDGGHSLAISDVIHKGFVAVDEDGTEAAAATAVVVGETSVPQAEATVRLDRPFLYLIRDHATGAILFVGRVAAPRA